MKTLTRILVGMSITVASAFPAFGSMNPHVSLANSVEDTFYAMKHGDNFFSSRKPGIVKSKWHSFKCWILGRNRSTKGNLAPLLANYVAARAWVNTAHKHGLNPLSTPSPELLGAIMSGAYDTNRSAGQQGITLTPEQYAYLIAAAQRQQQVQMPMPAPMPAPVQAPQPVQAEEKAEQAPAGKPVEGNSIVAQVLNQ